MPNFSGSCIKITIMIGWLIISSWDWEMMEEKMIKMEKERYRVLEQMEMEDAEDKPFDVKKYDYFLWLDPDSIRYAYNKIKFVATDVTDSVWVHFKVEYGGNRCLIVDSVIFEKGTWKWHVPTYYSIGDIFVMKPAIYLIPGDTFYMTIYYSGKGSADSITRDGIKYNAVLYGTEYRLQSITVDAQPYGNRRWLPLYDRYYEKVDTVISTFKVPVEYNVVSNGVRLFDTTDGMYRYVRWIETYPIAPYLIAFFASKDVEEYSDVWVYEDEDIVSPIIMPIYLWLDTNLNLFLDIEPDSILSVLKWRLAFLSDRFGVYPFYREKYSEGYVAGMHGMEYQTAVYSIFSLHEMIHQWWGDWVTAATHDGDVWLNEGFATYFTSFFLDKDLSRSLKYPK